jgi:localization factor PodJL
VQIANLTREVAAMRQTAATPRPELSSDPIIGELRSEVASVARMVDRLGSPGETAALEKRLDELGSRIDALRNSGANEAAIRSVENHVAEVVRSIGAGTHRELSTITAELKSVGVKLDQISAQQASALAPSHAFEAALRELKSDMATLSRSVSASPAKAFEPMERRLEGLAERIGELRADGASQKTLAQVEQRLASLATGLADIGPRNAKALADDLHAIQAKLDLIAAQRAETGARGSEALAEDLHAIQAKLDLIASQGADADAILRLQKQTETIHGLLANSLRADVLSNLAERIDSLGAQVDNIEATLARGQQGPSNASLEAMIQRLVERLETAQRPEADDRSLEALEQQIMRIAERLETRDHATPDLTAIEHSLSGLFRELERTREDAVGAADEAVARAVETAMSRISTSTDDEAVAQDMKRHLDDIRESQDVAERRTQITLDAVQATLERLADRIGQFEEELSTARLPVDSFGILTSTAPVPAAELPGDSEARAGGGPTPEKAARAERAPPAEPPSAEPPPARPRAAAIPAQHLDLGGEFPLEPGVGGARSTGASAPELSPARAMLAASGSSEKRASFIAAARRAVMAASNEAAQSGAPVPRDGRLEPTLPHSATSSPLPTEPRPDLQPELRPAQSPIERVRNLYQKKRRPILLGLAAVLVTLGTIQVTKLASPDPSEIDLGAVPAAKSAVETAPAKAAPSAPPALTSDPAMSPAPGSVEPPKPQSDLLAPAAQAPPIEPTKAALPPPSEPRPDVFAGVPSLTDALVADTGAPTADALPPSSGQRLEDAVKAGDPRALYDMASRLADSRNAERDFERAAALYERASDKGFAPAQYRLASMYEKGIGVAKDVTKARDLYARAADNGNVKAMHNMAVLYAEGAIGGKPDYAAAAQWFALAAEYGLRDSEYNLAILMARGLGTTIDYAAAYKWFALAADQGDTDAASKRDEVGTRLDTGALAKAKEAVASFHPKQAPLLANESTLPAVSWATTEQGGA